MGTIAETLLKQGEALGLSKSCLDDLTARKEETFLRQARVRFGTVPWPGS